MTVKGYSDDNIELEGSIREEIGAYNGDLTITTDRGDSFRYFWNDKKGWDAEIIHNESGTLELTPADQDDDDSVPVITCEAVAIMAVDKHRDKSYYSDMSAADLSPTQKMIYDALAGIQIIVDNDATPILETENMTEGNLCAVVLFKFNSPIFAGKPAPELKQVEKLADFLLSKYANQMQDEGAVDMAIRLLSGPTAHEAIVGMFGWLTTQPVPLVLSSAHNAAPVAQAIGQFIDFQGFPQVRDNFTEYLKPMAGESLPERTQREELAGMTKHDSKCLLRSDDDEPIFVLCGRDPIAPKAVEFWVQESKGDENHEKMSAALDVADAMREFLEKKNKE